MPTPARAPRPKPRGLGLGESPPRGFDAPPALRPSSRSMGPRAGASRVIANVPTPKANAAAAIETVLMRTGLLVGLLPARRLRRATLARCYTHPPAAPKMSA